MSENIYNTDERAHKARVIESMLVELGMSREELAELIRAIMEQSVSEGLEEGVQQVDAKILQLQPDEISSSAPAQLSIDQLAAEVAAGNTEFLSKYLSLEQLKKVNIQVGLAFALKRARDLGIKLEMDKLSLATGVEGMRNLSLSGGYEDSQGRRRQLNSAQSEKAGRSVTEIINNRQLTTGLDQQQQTQLQQTVNDPNSFTNPASTINVVRRMVSAVMMRADNLGLTPGGASTSLAQQQQQNQQNQQQQQLQQVQRTANIVRQIHSQLRRQEARMKRAVPEAGRINTRGGKVMATISDGKGGSKEVDLKEHLRGTNRLTPKLEKMLNKMSETGGKLEQGMAALSRGLPEAGSFQFDASGSLQVQFDSDKAQKLMHISDYINDLRRDVDRAKAKITEKKQEAVSKKAEAENNAGAQRQRELTRGPELDSANAGAAAAAASQESSLKYFQLDKPSTGLTDEEKPKEVKESKRMSNELIKLDAMHDRNKLLESVNLSREMKQIESSMKNVMKDMDEAEKNKDLLKDISRNKGKDRFIE